MPGNWTTFKFPVRVLRFLAFPLLLLSINTAANIGKSVAAEASPPSPPSHTPNPIDILEQLRAKMRPTDDEINKMKSGGTAEHIAGLGSNNNLVRIKAESLLVENPTNESIVALIQSLHNPNALIRHGAAYVLGRLKERSAVEPLFEALNDEDASTRFQSIVSIIEITSPDVSPDVLTWLEHNPPPDVDFTVIIIAFIVNYGIHGSEGLIIRWLDIIWAKDQTDDKDYMRGVIDNLLNCGNQILIDGSRQWAVIHGYRIVLGRPEVWMQWGQSALTAPIVDK